MESSGLSAQLPERILGGPLVGICQHDNSWVGKPQ